ncbi:hypothetical protein [Rhodococcus jostii]|uniref:hypothetical protein n=1 Tax=Rhodococcus jostii TaxID=132919 RepID=UPI003632B21E
MDQECHSDPEPASPNPIREGWGVRVWRWCTRLGWWLRGAMGDRPASRYSSVAPRHPDGTRTAIIAFNGSGYGR